MSYHITCPYCFADFDDTEVHFRMETYFDESGLNDEAYTKSEVLRMPDSGHKEELMHQIDQREPFLRKDDEKYNNFWHKYGGTSERTTGVDKRLPFPVHQLPVLAPSNPEDQRALKLQNNNMQGAERYLIFSDDGMAIAVEDSFGHKTHRRVCPHCHNPLPLGFGKFPLKFISVIGVTTAGKTVYISQLLKYMSKYTSQVGMSSYFTTNHEPDFIEDNPVEAGKPLPRSTMSGHLSQPMFYDLQQPNGSHIRTDTVVIYDIAGEDCKTGQELQAYGEFVTRSDGIIFLVDPGQLKLTVADKIGEAVASAEPNLVLNSIHTAFMNKSGVQRQTIPIAVCLSKSDTFDTMLPEVAATDISKAINRTTNQKLTCFNATEYNTIEPELLRLVEDDPMFISLQNGFENFNFFAFSATGCAVEKRMVDGEERSFPVAPPVPKRIAEPLLWLFYKFGFIGSDVPIRLPAPRPHNSQIEIPKRLPFGKPHYRPLTSEEEARYWYEERC